jgi:hypothetical protein
VRRLVALVLALVACGVPARAQDHASHAASSASGWTFMQDGVAWIIFNAQGTSRGSRELKVPNWWMGMFERPLGRGVLTFSVMFSLDPATVGAQGHSHIFQVGESFRGTR